MLLFGLMMSHLDFATEPDHLGFGPLLPLALGFGLLKRLTRPFALPFDLCAQPVQLDFSSQPLFMFAGQSRDGSCSASLLRPTPFALHPLRLRIIRPLPWQVVVAFQRVDGLRQPCALALVQLFDLRNGCGQPVRAGAGLPFSRYARSPTLRLREPGPAFRRIARADAGRAPAAAILHGWSRSRCAVPRRMVNLPRFPEADASDTRITSPCASAAPVPLQPLRLAQAMGTAVGWRSFMIIPGRPHPSGAAFLRLPQHDPAYRPAADVLDASE